MNLRPQRKNANKHSEHGLRLLEKSLQQDGWIDAQTIAADGEMISGSARLEVAGEKFADVEPIIVESDGTRPVIVKRTDIPNADDPRARRLSVAANQIAATDWNPDGDLLKEWGNEDKDIRAMFADSEWEEVTGEKKPSKDAEPQIDRAAELLEKWQVKTGDLWQIGEHRLICGDCTDAAVVARVMGGERAELCFTSPPYNGNTDLVYKKRGKEKKLYGNHYDDNLESQKYIDFVLSFIDLTHSILSDSGNLLLNISYNSNSRHEYLEIALRTIKDFSFSLMETIIWKKALAMPIPGYHFTRIIEFIFWFSKDENNLLFNKETFEPERNIWEITNQKSQSAEHAAGFPVGLPEKGIKLFCNNGAIVYEPFSGSGTTLVACQNLGRRGRAVEISPAYCAVTLERMAQAFPGIEIKRL